MSSNNKLYFNSVEVSEDKDGNVTVTPNFLCPRCGNQKNPATRPTAKLASEKALVAKAEGTIEKNAVQRFVMPCCGTEINLYVAVHKAKTGKPAVQISRESIDSVWFEKLAVK